MSGSAAKLAERMRYWCTQADLGYDQSNRWDIRPGGECDCSSLVIFAAREAGFNTYDASYTGDMKENFTRGGQFEWIPYVPSPLQVGDILLNERSHVAVYVGNNQIAQASIDENGRISGGKSGDQSDRETNVRSYYDKPWDGVLRATAQAGVAPLPTTETIEVDGWWGRNTTRALQQALGTEADSIVSGQSAVDLNKCNRGGLLDETWRRGPGGSPMIRAMQSKIGCSVDGYMGPDTTRALQRYLSTPVDGWVDGPSDMVRALQKRLNAKSF